MHKAIRVHLHIMMYLDESHTYKEALKEMERFAPGWFETDGDPMIIEWIINHCI